MSLVFPSFCLFLTPGTEITSVELAPQSQQTPSQTRHPSVDPIHDKDNENEERNTHDIIDLQAHATAAVHKEPRQEEGQQPPAYTPIVTPAPDSDAILSKMGFYQTTFYACNTYPSGQEHCGWQIPVVKADGAKTQIEVVVMVITCFAGLFAMGLM